MCNGFICGGFYINPDIDIDDTCVRWNDEKKGFDDLDLRLIKARDNIVCWGLPSGDVLLFGGADENYGENGGKCCRNGIHIIESNIKLQQPKGFQKLQEKCADCAAPE